MGLRQETQLANKRQSQACLNTQETRQYNYSSRWTFPASDQAQLCLCNSSVKCAPNQLKPSALGPHLEVE